MQKKNPTMNKLFKYSLAVSALLLWSCSNLKYLPEGDALYVGGEVTVEDTLLSKSERKKLEKELEPLLRPKPNSSFLGLRPKLYFYNIAGEPKKDKGFRYWLRNKVGEPPVLFSQVDMEYNESILQNYAENKGFFKTATESDSTGHSKNRKVTAEYIVKPGPQYKIKSVTFPQDSSQLSKDIAQVTRRSRLREGRPYDLDRIKAERERIDGRLKEKGYFFFSPDYLLVQVDSTVGNKEVDLIVKVKDETPNRAKQIYTINDITIYPNYSLNADDSLRSPNAYVEEYKDLTIIDTIRTFKPKIFDESLAFNKGDVYNRTDHNLSLNRLINLGNFKFVKNEFEIADSTSNSLDAFYYLTPLPKKSIRVEVLAKTNSANYTGTELNVNWSNRNTFKGAELLTLTGFGGIEVQVSGQNRGYNVYRFGGEASLVWPRFISPFNLKSSSEFVPRTRAMIGFEHQQRQRLYTLNTFKSSFGYLWKENVRKEHQLNVTEITFVRSGHVTDEYNQQIIGNGTAEDPENPALARVIEDQLIFGPNYSYTYTNTMERRRKNTFYYKGSLDLSATITGLIAGGNPDDPKKVLGVPFSQFAKMEHEFRHYLRLGRNSQLASRVIAGVGVPYGNSDQLPFIKQFFIGGTNSIRAFRARSIGPGTFRKEVAEDSFLPDQSGDIKLELNTEYRAKLFSVVHGAIFVDAGNIWLMNKDDRREGAEFSKKFLDELAVGTGAGLRLDLSFLILRLDLAFPIRKPYLPEGDRWVFDQINFGSSTWRKENLVFNLAIGYPF
ncbi:BamA/TamA family outer membrane protein [Flavobacterium sp. NST-5]|uniref:BamA/TamA family outer membrane protein n=2 Tax=Flavobacterium ichthyis TaxID=2698827 RepID=A0ABW9Z671_9FLAO|nr:BamA/TamA family outer membrane protein [Flavobacterium ichthyis]